MSLISAVFNFPSQSAAVLLAKQHSITTDDMHYNNLCNNVCHTNSNNNSELAAHVTASRPRHPSCDSRPLKRDGPRTSHSAGPARRQRSAATVARSLWDRMRYMDRQMAEITEQYGMHPIVIL